MLRSFALLTALAAVSIARVLMRGPKTGFFCAGKATTLPSGGAAAVARFGLSGVTLDAAAAVWVIGISGETGHGGSKRRRGASAARPRSHAMRLMSRLAR